MTCLVTLYHYNFIVSGNVGPPIPSNLIKLDDVPDMNYFADQNKGEVRRQNSYSSVANVTN